MKYKHIAIGGTFDLMHEGHKKFIKHAFSLAKRVTIGVTSERLVRELKGGSIQTFDQRFEAIYNFVIFHKFLSRVCVVPLDNFFGPTLDDRTIDCLLVTEDSLKGAKMINEARFRLGLKKLPVEIFPLVLGSDNKEISSGRIKNGMISSQGLNYYDYLIKKGDLYLPQNLRAALRQPFGATYKDLRKINRDKSVNKLLATVGDYTTQLFLKNGFNPDLSVIDFKIQRANTYESVMDLGFSGQEKIIKAVSPPGIISQALVKAVHKSLIMANNNKTIILVDGEEDLSVLVLSLMAPLGSIIYYGIRNKGSVEMKVDLNLKDELFQLIDLFRKK